MFHPGAQIMLFLHSQHSGASHQVKTIIVVLFIMTALRVKIKGTRGAVSGTYKTFCLFLFSPHLPVELSIPHARDYRFFQLANSIRFTLPDRENMAEKQGVKRKI